MDFPPVQPGWDSIGNEEMEKYIYNRTIARTGYSIGNFRTGQEASMVQQVEPPGSSLAQLQLPTTNNEQPGPQQATQGQTRGVGGPLPRMEDDLFAEHTFERDRCRMIRQRLLLILHANACYIFELEERPGKKIPCPLPGCRDTKILLVHMWKCHAYYNCPMPSCTWSRSIISHWERCANKYCPFCVLVEPSNGSRLFDALERFKAQQQFKALTME